MNKTKLHFEKAREMQVMQIQTIACPIIWIRKLEGNLKGVSLTKKEKSVKKKDIFIKA